MFGMITHKLSCHGFGLMEFILIMLLLTTTAVSFASSFNFSPTYLKHAEERLMADVRYAKNLALTRGDYFGVYFEPSQNRYTVFQDTPDTPVSDPADRSQNLVVDFDDNSGCLGVDLSSASFQGGKVLLFDAEGTPNDGFGWPMYTEGSIVIANESGAKTLLVSPGTGKIREQ